MLRAVSRSNQILPGETDPVRQAHLLLEAARKLAPTDLPAALPLCDEIVVLANAHGTDNAPLQDQLAQCLHLRGTLFLNQADYGSALLSFSRAGGIYESLDNSYHAALQQFFIGVAQAYAGLYADAVQDMRAALTVFEANDDPRMVANCLNSIGHTFGQLNEHSKALPYLIKSVLIARDTDDKRTLSTCLDSLCQAYLGIGDLDTALECGLESVQVAREGNAVAREAEHLLSVGSVHHARGELALATSCFQQTLALARKHGYRFAEAGALRRMGSACKQQDQTADALRCLREALAIARSIGHKRETYICLENMAAACKLAGDFEAALDHFEQFQLAREAIFNEQADIRLKTLEIAYEVEQAKKEKEIYNLRNVALQREIEERIKAQAAAELLSITDQLTGLFNRRHLLCTAENEVAKALRYKTPLSLVIFDIDFFKKVNDNYGHAVGDKILAVVSSHVGNSLRAGDVLGRYGGEEFVILLPHTSTETARLMIERLRKSIATLVVRTGNAEVSVTISAGIAGLAGDGRNDRLDRLLERADQALYAAKAAGRNQTAVCAIPVAPLLAIRSTDDQDDGVSSGDAQVAA